MQFKYTISKIQSIPAGSTISFLGIPQTSTTFTPIQVSSDEPLIRVTLLENPIISNPGTPQVPQALNRLNLAPSRTEVYAAPTFTGGTELFTTLTLEKKHTGSETNLTNAFYLTPDTPYVYTITNQGTHAANVAINFAWEEFH